MAQGYGGIMSVTGAPDGAPMKVGVGIADVMCGPINTIKGALTWEQAQARSAAADIARADVAGGLVRLLARTSMTCSPNGSAIRQKTRQPALQPSEIARKPA
tara:strand:- start:696 stop:1001 length:306 start_codon:yes stop_codon:yes gene_type:complete